MNRAQNKFMILLAVVVLLPLGASAQEEPQGVNQGNYNIKQSFEFGGRVVDFTGNQATYRTFVNLYDGPRLLEHTLQMRSLNHQGWLFDDFFLTSFGYGGDPNAVSRLRMYKNKWYNFSATFRMDRNQWDYNLLANPLNPPNSNPSTPTVPINAAFPADTSTTFSLHKFETVRRLSDFNLTLAPQSMFRVRLGYSRNIAEGPSLTTFHEGTDVLLFQNWKTTLSSYSIGVDFRGIPRTNISYDQFLHYYKGDTTWDDTPGVSQLGVPRFPSVVDPTPAAPNSGDEVPADLGIIFNPALAATSRQPCQTPLLSQATATTPATANPQCNIYLAYDRSGRVRTDYPAEQLSFQSSYFKNVDLSGRLVYSSGDSVIPTYEEVFRGLVTRTRQQQFTIDGLAKNKRVSVTADLGVTFYLTDQFRIVDSFRFNHFRLTGFGSFDEVSLFPRTTPISALTPSASFPTTTPQHSTSSPADVLTEEFSRFLGQDSQYNQIDFLYDITRRVGVRVGYRYYFREITEHVAEGGTFLFYPTLANRQGCATTAPTFPLCVTNADGSVGLDLDLEEVGTFQEDFIEHTGLLGVWARPMDNLRVSFDMQLMSSNNAFTRISPRQRQIYKVRSTYRPYSWLDLSGTVNIHEQRNNVEGIFHKQHARTYGFAAMLYPNDRFALDFGYDFNDLESATLICFTLTPVPSGTSTCPAATSTQALTSPSFYDSNTHFAYFNLMAKPVKRLTTKFGYALTSSDGVSLLLNPIAPPGPLRYNFHRPFGGIDLDLSRGFTFKTYWNHYGYNEKSDPDPSSCDALRGICRDFRGNTVTLSIRYAF